MFTKPALSFKTSPEQDAETCWSALRGAPESSTPTAPA